MFIPAYLLPSIEKPVSSRVEIPRVVLMNDDVGRMIVNDDCDDDTDIRCRS